MVYYINHNCNSTLGGSKFGFSDKTIQISKYLMYASMIGIKNDLEEEKLNQLVAS